MKQRHQFSQQVLLAKMREADRLATAIREMEEGEDRNLLLLRWAIVADEVTALATLAEEVLSEAVLSHLRASVNRGQPTRWEMYRHGGRRVKEATGKELWEHPRFDITIAELLGSQAPDEKQEEG